MATQRRKKSTAKAARPARPKVAKDIQIDIKKADELWSSYTLSDGSVLRLKPVVVEVVKSPGKLTPSGDPVYSVRSTLIIDVKSQPAQKKVR